MTYIFHWRTQLWSRNETLKIHEVKFWWRIIPKKKHTVSDRLLDVCVTLFIGTLEPSIKLFSLLPKLEQPQRWKSYNFSLSTILTQQWRQTEHLSSYICLNVINEVMKKNVGKIINLYSTVNYLFPPIIKECDALRVIQPNTYTSHSEEDCTVWTCIKWLYKNIC